ncbi:MAG TPA: RDD family protein [Candidatus Binatia bacterium]|nr:RDD family protein [Candidatus Binatia bacterium]
MQSAVEPVDPALAGADAAPVDELNSAWRGELAARLSRYRARRKAPPPRYPSLKLPFEGTAVPRSFSDEGSRFPTFEPASNHALALDAPRTEPMDELVAADFTKETVVGVTIPVSPPVTQVSAKIIEFPRSAWAPPPPPPDQLAEPVSDKPRILEVPEVAPPPPALGGISIEPAEIQEIEKRPGIDFPLQSAPLGRRLIACFLDGLLVAAASALFGFIFWKVAAVQPPQLQLYGLAGAILFGFWVVYQYLLIVYSATTPGLRAAGLQLTRFDGTPTTRSLRRWRLLASYLSALSLGMGYAWVFLDEDSLCWHDRITHTFLSPLKTNRD